jgi:hypothetical protein
MVSVDLKESKEFFKKITGKEKVTIFCHTDLEVLYQEFYL